MTFKRFIIALLSIPILSYWLILSPVIPTEKMSVGHYIYSEDGEWKLRVYRVSVSTPVSFIQFWQEKKYIVLYKKNGEYIGQSTPFCTQSFDDFNILFPDNYHSDLWFMAGECDFTIYINKPKWWSKIIKFRLSL